MLLALMTNNTESCVRNLTEFHLYACPIPAKLALEVFVVYVFLEE